MIKIKGINSLEIEERSDGKYDISIDYTSEFEDLVKLALNKKRITKKDIIKFISDTLNEI